MYNIWIDRQIKLMPDFTLQSPPPIPGKVDRLVQLLALALQEGAFAPGQRFHSTRDIVGQYQVSVGTAQKALASLVQRGYLDSVRGSGFYVSKRVPAIPVDRSDAAGLVAPPMTLLVVIGRGGRYGKKLLEDYVDAVRTECAKLGWDIVRTGSAPEEIARAGKGVRLCGCLAFGLDGPIPAGIDPSTTIVWSGTWYDPENALVTVDGAAMTQMAFEHLGDLGHTRMALVRRKLTGIHRQEDSGIVVGMRKSFATFGIPWNPDDVLDVDHETPGELYDLLTSRGITAIYCNEWEVGFALYQQARARGESIGQRLSIIFSGGSDLRTTFDPYPTRIYWRFSDFAQLVVSSLRESLAGKPIPHRLMMPVFLELGSSTQPVARA